MVIVVGCLSHTFQHIDIIRWILATVRPNKLFVAQSQPSDELKSGRYQGPRGGKSTAQDCIGL